MNYARIAHRLREQIIKFSGELSAGLPKVVGRFVTEAIYGIQARQSVRLTSIARSLGEKIALKKTHYRLCRQLGRAGLWQKLTHALIKLASRRVREDTLLVMDSSDICKRYAKKMEYLVRVYDGSEKRIAKGYWTCNVVAAETGEVSLTPLYSKLYSQASPQFDSANDEMLQAVDMVCQHTEKRGVWVLDRGGDRENIIHPLLERELSFIIRLVGDRHLLYRGRKIRAHELAKKCWLPYAEKVVKEEKGKERIYMVQFGFRRVRLPGRKELLSLVVIRGFGEEPMMLLSSLAMRKKRSVLWWVIESYLTRWRIEDTFRFIKQSYQLEDIRLLTYRRLQNMMALIMAVAYFAFIYLGERTKLRVLALHVLKGARRLFGIPNFHFYALADGIREFLFSQKKTMQSFHLVLKTHNLQRNLFDP